jgi:ribosome-associated protein
MTRGSLYRNFILPDHLISYETMRSGGKGGQGVNTTDSAVRARVNIWRLTMLTYEERRRLGEKLRHQLTQEGELTAKSQTTRSQLENKHLAKARLEELIRDALHVPEVRIPTRPTRSSRERRITQKKKLGQKKATRRSSGEE